MRKVFGVFCILLGIACLLAALGLVVYNHNEEKSAEAASRQLLQDVQLKIALPPETTEPVSAQPPESEPTSETLPREMPAAQVNGYDCVGVLSIPVLELELPVLADWDYAKLKVAPCQYFGDCYEPNFVIAAHNYPSHFGRLSQLEKGDLILFTDMTGTLFCYEVVLLETLPGDATEEMITSGFDLSLYTCTPGGASRVTVRCNTVNLNQK